jgi:hypothetical protein
MVWGGTGSIVHSFFEQSGFFLRRWNGNFTGANVYRSILLTTAIITMAGVDPRTAVVPAAEGFISPAMTADERNRLILRVNTFVTNALRAQWLVFEADTQASILSFGYAAVNPVAYVRALGSAVSATVGDCTVHKLMLLGAQLGAREERLCCIRASRLDGAW